ncbi:MAG TPA: hypothetical protein VK768_01750 [Chthoniobacterales bacterium]|jgi:hypothetical protein|nr:hypothetical protein [Chthoniobacterales bacterium]
MAAAVLAVVSVSASAGHEFKLPTTEQRQRGEAQVVYQRKSDRCVPAANTTLNTTDTGTGTDNSAGGIGTEIVP